MIVNMQQREKHLVHRLLNLMSLWINLGIGLQKDLEIFTSVQVDLACGAGVLLGQVTEHYNLATAMLDRSTPTPILPLAYHSSPR